MALRNHKLQWQLKRFSLKSLQTIKMRFMQMTYRRDGNLLEEKRLDIPVINTWPDYQPLAQSIMGISHQ